MTATQLAPLMFMNERGLAACEHAAVSPRVDIHDVQVNLSGALKELDAQRAALATVTQERDAAIAKQSEFLSLKEVLLRPGDYRARFQGEGATLLFMALAHAFTEVGGKNFVEMKVGVVSMQSPDFLLTMQKLDGKTPAELHAEEKALRVAAEADLATAQAALAAARALVGKWRIKGSDDHANDLAVALTADAAARSGKEGEQ